MEQVEIIKKRDEKLDIARAICIILMVMGHCNCPGMFYIYMFHMPLFFLFSGICFSSKSYMDIKSVFEFIKRKIKHLYFPFIISNVFLVLIHNILLKFNIYTTNRALVEFQNGNTFGVSDYFNFTDFIYNIIQVLIFRHGEALAGPTWFLRVLFYITVLSCIAHFVLNKIKNIYLKHSIIALSYISLLGIGYALYCLNFKFYSIGVMCSSAIIFYFGILYKRFANKFVFNIYTLLLGLACLFIARFFNVIKFEIGQNYYNNPFWLIFTTISGFFVIYTISGYILKTTFYKNLLNYIGRHTLSIMLLHLTFFKIVNLVQIYIYKLPSYMLAGFPCIYTNGIWWIFYTIIGVLGPLFTIYIIYYLKQKFKNLTKISL